MRIECPNCEAAYEVPEAQIRPGRSVRCARCAVQWRPGGEQEDLAASEPVPDAAEDTPETVPEIAPEIAPEVPPGIAPGIAAEVADEAESPPPVVADAVAEAGPAQAAAGRALGLRRPAASEPIAALAIAVARRPSPELAAWGAGWAVSLVVLAGLLLSAAHWRHAVMRSWPPSIRLYTALGAAPPG